MALNPSQITALTTELNNDPQTIGYAPLRSANDWNGLVELLNKPTSTLILRNDLSSKEIVNNIVPADFAALDQLQLAKLQALFMQNSTIDATNSNMQAIFTGIFSGMPTTINALLTVAQRPGSRAEILFGTGILIVKNDVLRACGQPIET